MPDAGRSSRNFDPLRVVNYRIVRYAPAVEIEADIDLVQGFANADTFDADHVSAGGRLDAHCRFRLAPAKRAVLISFQRIESGLRKNLST